MIHSITLFLLACIVATQAVPIASTSREAGMDRMLAKRTPKGPSCHKNSKLQKRAAVDICTVKHNGNNILIKGEKISTEDSHRGGIYMITEAPGLGTGHFFAKKGVSANELHGTEKSGLLKAKSEDGTCIVMEKVGMDIRELPSYRTAHRAGLTKCKEWATGKAEIVAKAAQDMRKKPGLENWQHADLKPANTRWISETEVVLIDFGEAKLLDTPYNANTDKDRLVEFEWLFKELCGNLNGKSKDMDPPEMKPLESTLINGAC
ncbi:hypothetical protein FRC14_006807 [Serendipita sp. 396]|nr:hypothetical protein FRC14_006807 [Serendipita sp. 396]KAG8778057.1 hypothetical protein FRC15_010983 [Serendipita sp. 397]KAG8795369.1 hypothetical protein FRC16_010104 [Serendipita sp. 398]KAG8863662.1 hypothetical protein FRC20_010593 [Serendipita sp. 405]